MKVTAALTFTVPDNCDADTLASLLDAVGRALRADPSAAAAVRVLLDVFIADADVTAFRLGERGDWTVKAGATFDPTGNVLRALTDVQLRDALDLVLAGYLASHRSKLPSTTTALDLIKWLGGLPGGG